MSVTADVFIKFDGNKKQLTKILSDRFQLPLRRRDRWLLGYVEMNLTSRQEAPDYFTERELRAYDFALGGTVYVRSSELGEAYAAHQLIMEVLAQVIAARLKTWTMLRHEMDDSCHFYRPANANQRKKGIAVIDAKTGKPPKHIFR